MMYIAANDCIATIAFADDGSNGNFYCINGGVIGGTTGACNCTQCDSIFMGDSCVTRKCAVLALETRTNRFYFILLGPVKPCEVAIIPYIRSAGESDLEDAKR